MGFKPGIGGNWQEGDSSFAGGGMGSHGRGRGGQIGDLPDANGNFTPSLLPGQMQQGPMLATVNQLTKPDDHAEASLDYLPGQMVQVQQEAEQALAQEQIPPGAKEFVRQYFGTLDQQQAAQK